MALSERDVLEKLNTIPTPNGRQSLVEAGAVRRLEVDDANVRLSLALEVPRPEAIEAMRAEVIRQLESIPGVEEADVQVQPVLPTIQGSGPAPAPSEPTNWADRIPGVKRVIAVASGKGGVGKSTVAANIALAMARQGRAVGLLDADIYGPSQQLMMGAEEPPTGDEQERIRPVTVPGGVKVMSFGFIVDPDQPVIWRGPMLQKALEQLFGDVLWGELDDLVVDLPPGTGDVALTLCQQVPMAGVIIVTTPQDVALIDARKGLHMFRKLGVPVFGIVENMSFYECTECGHIEHIFGSGGGRRTAEALEIPFLGSIPIDPAIVAGGDAGSPVVLDRPESAAARAFEQLARTLAESGTDG
jgi:ATP-binding protein involved in chromosome partitioning